MSGSYPRAAIIQKSNNGFVEHPPEYLVLLARKAGISLTEYRWVLSVGGRYNSKKIIFFLYNRQTREPEVVIKLTRSVIFNKRLENEYRVLNLFSKKQIVHESSVPKPLFFDYHCGLAVIGQKIIKGTAFSKRTEYTDNCRYAKGVIDWLTNLAQETADYQSATSKQVAEALLCLFDQFRKIYTLPNDLLNLLNKQIESVALLDAKFPLVFQHGDAGSWNVLITEI